MQKKQRICPVCGHLEDINTDYCTECGAKTIEYEEASNDRKPVSETASQPIRTSMGTSDTYPKQKKGKGGKAILPLVLVVLTLGGSVFAFLSKDGPDRQDDLSAANESSVPASYQQDGASTGSSTVESVEPTLTSSPCEASGHTWLEANYQEPQICSVCGEAMGAPLIPSFELHGLSANLKEGITYDYVTACNHDPSFKTIGHLTISDYRVFESDASHQAKAGYEWRTVHISITYDDENAWNYGISLGLSNDNYYDVEGWDRSLYYDSEDILWGTANYYGIDYSECAIIWEGRGFSEWHDQTITWEQDLYAQLPVGYDGLVIGFFDDAVSWDDGMYIYDIADENTLFFRMK